MGAHEDLKAVGPFWVDTSARGLWALAMASIEPLDAPLFHNESDGSAKTRSNYGLAIAFSLLPFVFNAISKVITKQIAATRTEVEDNWMGWSVPVGTVFVFPVFLATVQFFSNAAGAVLAYKWLYGGSMCADLKKAVKTQIAGRLVFTKAVSSIGAKSGLMGMPLSLYAVA